MAKNIIIRIPNTLNNKEQQNDFIEKIKKLLSSLPIKIKYSATNPEENDDILFPKNIEVEIYNPDEGQQEIPHQQGYEQRIDSLYSCAQALMNNHLGNLSSSNMLMLIHDLQKSYEETKRLLREKEEETLSKKMKKYDTIYRDFVTSSIEILRDFLGNKVYSHKQIAHLLDRAEQYHLLTQPRPIVCTLVDIQEKEKNTINYLLFINIPQPSITDENIRLWSKIKDDTDISIFRSPLNELQKKFYLNTIKKINHHVKCGDYEYADLSVSSRLDIDENVRNFQEEHIYLIDNMDLKPLTNEHRLSIVGSRLNKNDLNSTADKNIINSYKTKIANHNFEHALKITIMSFLNKNPVWPREKLIPVLYQTLITPLIVKAEDFELYKAKLDAIKHSREKISSTAEYIPISLNEQTYNIDLIEMNFALNIGRHVLTTSLESANGEACKKLILYANECIENNEAPNPTLLQDTCIELTKVITMKPMEIMRSPPYRRELHLASLCNIIAKQIGTSLGGCISAKDRKAIERLYTASCLYYHETTGKLPSFFDAPDSAERQRFVNIITRLFCSQHQQILSGLNATGANALKTPLMYLPDDVSKCIQSKLCEDYLIVENRLASTNNIKYRINEDSQTACERMLSNLKNNDMLIGCILPELYERILSDLDRGAFPTDTAYTYRFNDGVKSYPVPTQLFQLLTLIEPFMKENEEKSLRTYENIREALVTISNNMNSKSSAFSLFHKRQEKTQQNYHVIQGIIEIFLASLSKCKPESLPDNEVTAAPN
jgi:hypothetical protein